MLMRHDLSGTQPPAVLPLPIGVIPPTLTAPLMPAPGGAHARLSRRHRARRRAVPIPLVTRTTEQEFPRATRAPPHPQPLHAAAVAAAVDFADRPCEARSTGWIDPLAVGSLRQPGAATPGCCLFGALPPLSLRQRRADQQSPVTYQKPRGASPRAPPNTNPSTKSSGHIPLYPALAMIDIPRFSMIASSHGKRPICRYRSMRSWCSGLTFLKLTTGAYSQASSPNT